MARVKSITFELVDGSQLTADVRECTFSSPGTFAPQYEGFTERMTKSKYWDVQMVIAAPQLFEARPLYDTPFAPQPDGNPFMPFPPQVVQTVDASGVAELERRAALRQKGLDPDEDRGVNTDRFKAIEIEED